MDLTKLPYYILKFCIKPYITRPEQLYLELALKRPMRDITIRENMNVVFDELLNYEEYDKYDKYDKYDHFNTYENNLTIYTIYTEYDEYSLLY